jgi:hypothetical protein
MASLKKLYLEMPVGTTFGYPSSMFTLFCGTLSSILILAVHPYKKNGRGGAGNANVKTLSQPCQEVWTINLLNNFN